MPKSGTQKMTKPMFRYATAGKLTYDAGMRPDWRILEAFGRPLKSNKSPYNARIFRRWLANIQSTQIECATCNGSGEVTTNACEDCEGKGKTYSATFKLDSHDTLGLDSVIETLNGKLNNQSYAISYNRSLRAVSSKLTRCHFHANPGLPSNIQQRALRCSREHKRS